MNQIDISDEILENIRSNESLHTEHQHINNLIQQSDSDLSKISIWFMGIFIASLGAVLSTIAGFSINLIEEGKSYSVEGIKSAVPFLFDLTLYAASIAVVIFILTLFSSFHYRKKLIKRKEKIIQLRCRLSEMEGK